MHKHIGNILYKYGWNHNLDNKVICIYMTGGGGGGWLVYTAHVETFVMKVI